MSPGCAAATSGLLAALLLSAAAALPAAADMARIPAGEYRPLYKASDADGKGTAGEREVVAEFLLDERAATNSQFLRFVTENPRWRKSAAAGGLLADANYLHGWLSDLDPGPQAAPEAPVVFVSWFAARAFCKSRGGRLPTVAQWEYAAAASATAADGRDDERFRARLLEWYAQPVDRPAESATGFRNHYGVYEMHGIIWEWTSDFNTALVSGESRGDSGLDRSLFCGSGSVGSADFRDYPGFMRFAFRSSLKGSYTVGSLGFRCACSGRGCAAVVH